MRYCLAIDIGASSGRHIVGWQENGKLHTQEVYRFSNGVKEEKGHLVWDVAALLAEVKKGILEAVDRFGKLYSLSVDTWGVDYVLLEGDRELLPVYAYRDERTKEQIDKVHKHMPFEKLYSRTGCQFQPFNSVYQLFDDKEKGRLDRATDLLMIPEYLLYKLCGTKAREYTNATTMGLVSGKTGEFDEEILAALGYPKKLFPRLSYPGMLLGYYRGIRCVLCATHDTASAVEGIPMEGNEPYISSGTWSLLGVKTEKPLTDAASRVANYSNEGGIGYTRYQKNIMGMWLVNRLREELCPQIEFGEVVRLAEESSCEALVDANAPEFLSPRCMKEAFDKATENRLKTPGDYFRCAYRSLAFSYKKALEELESATGKVYERLYIVGGGARNEFLNQLTGHVTGKQVTAMPIEATALGNLKIQLEGS